MNLVILAKEARKKAYCPYSNFQVGASLETDEGKIFTGCNVENMSYGATLCAERVAFVKAVSEGHTKFKKLCVYTDQGVYPCGMCLQFFLEFAEDDAEIIVAGLKGESTYTFADLLPKAFKFRP